ncbi:MAG: FAD-binding oxidoreductase [Candidatus Helarchaeota archaeon]|nr:FAD-binding oxidoreductase [Candidatus Helarchaeota archaeon]
MSPSNKKHGEEESLDEVFKPELVKIVGEDFVVDDPAKIKENLTDYSFFPKHYPQYVIFPKTLKEVQKIVKLANKCEIPVIPRSSDVGFYGEGFPAQGGIVVKLSRMNGILDINERNRVIRIETGVKWKDIQEPLKKAKLRPNMHLFPHPEKSVLSSYLERYPSIIPMYEYSEPLGALEVVMGNGVIFRTGSAAGPGKPEEAPDSVKFVDPAGPGSSDFYRIIQGSQGTICVVTWGSLKVETIPTLQKACFLSTENLDSLIECIYRFQRRMIGYECFVLNNVNWAIILSQQLSMDYAHLQKALPPWVMLLVFGGLKRYPEEKIAYEEEILFEITKEFAFAPQKDLPEIPNADQEILKIIGEPWQKDPYWKFSLKGNCCDIFFLTTMDKVPTFDKAIKEKIQQLGGSTDSLGVYLQPIEYGRACHVEYNLFYDETNSEELQRIQEIYREASKVIYDLGGFFSRPYGIWAEMVYTRDNIYTDTTKKTKEVFDPNNIMHPGYLFKG